MTKFINFLSERRGLNGVLLLIYFLAVVLPHEAVGLAINAFFSRFSRDTYNQIILVGSIGLISIVLILLFQKIWKQENRFKIFGFWSITIFLIYIVNSYLFVINIESVHYVQYAIFGILCFPLFSNYYVTLFWATIAGIIDEAYQYFILAPERTDYYDINDIITNFLGVCLGLLILKSWPIISKNNKLSFEGKWILPYLAVISIGFVILLFTPYLSLYPSDDAYHMVRVMPEGFWSEIPKFAVYHVVLPEEGFFIMVALFVIYFFCFHDSDNQK